MNGELPQAPFRIIPVKFVGGVLAIGSGLALGREGPSVQMGATMAHLIGKVFRRNWPDCRVLLAAGAGAGLATAFNAPIAGAIFVLEELVRRFEPRIAIAALGASATAYRGVTRAARGCAGLSCRSLELCRGRDEAALLCPRRGRRAYGDRLQSHAARNDRRGGVAGPGPVELRAALIGAAVGTLAWFRPDLVGGGDVITQRTLAGAEPLAMLPVVFLLRLGLGAVSYAAGRRAGCLRPC